MSTGGGTTTTTQNSEPWKAAQPYLTDLMSQAQNYYKTQSANTDYAPFNTVVDPSQNTMQGLDLTAQRAMNGSPVTDAAQSSLTGILGNNAPSPGDATLSNIANGGDPTAYLNNWFNAAAAPVTDAVNAQFGAGGRTGSVANQQALTRNLGDLSAQIFGQGYGQQQANQMGAANALNANAATRTGQQLQGASLAPGVAGADYTDLQNLLATGGARDAQSQAKIDDLLTRWAYPQQQQANLLSQYSGLVSGLGALGGSSVGTQKQPGQSLIPGLLGGAVKLAAAPATGGGSLFSSFLGF